MSEWANTMWPTIRRTNFTTFFMQLTNHNINIIVLVNVFYINLSVPLSEKVMKKKIKILISKKVGRKKWLVTPIHSRADTYRLSEFHCDSIESLTSFSSEPSRQLVKVLEVESSPFVLDIMLDICQAGGILFAPFSRPCSC